MSIQTDIITAKALRKSFNTTQSELLRETFWSDENLIEKVREMQEEYKLFNALCDSIEHQDKELYEAQILGL